jgi:type IV pilus biogenesis protein CpaD/CtpE
MRRLVLLGLLLGAATAIVAGCQSTDKKEAVGAADDSRWQIPRFIYADKWWGHDEMGGLDR